VVMNEVVDPVFNRADITFSGVPDFRNYYSNIKIKVETEEGTFYEPITKVWLSSPDRRQYQGIVFSPGQDVPGFYNLYQGLAIEPRQGDWSLMRNHIWNVIASQNEEIFHYLIAWMAQLVQDPGGNKIETSIVLRGRQGVGKGCFISQFGKIFGSNFLHITHSSHLVSRFNSHLKSALLVFADEVLWGGDRAAEGIIRGMITEPFFMCEAKGRDAFPVKNHVHLMLASNHDWLVPAGLEERRFVVIDVNDTHMQDRDYFSALFDQMNNGGREAMLHELLEVDLDCVNLKKIPSTEALFDQKVRTMPTAEKFWLERLQKGTLIDEHNEWEFFIIIDKLHKAYMDFADNCGDRYKLIAHQFGKKLRILCPEFPGDRGMRRQRLTLSDGKRPWAYTFPSLEDCRRKFEELVKSEINWDEDMDDNGLPFE